MICFISAALTTDGFIGKDSAHAASWTSKEDKKRFIEITKREGVVVMGLNTYRTLGKPLKDRLNVVYSPEKLTGADAIAGVETTTKAPADLLADLADRGYKEVAICGGSQIYTMFMESGVVDKLYLTIEPLIFGAGMKLFNKGLDNKLTLVSSEKTTSGALLLEYNVK